MTAEIIALIGLALVFTVSALRNVHMGALALVAAFVVGIGIVGESLDDVLGGFPVDALVILLGITYLFGIARETGTIDWLVDRSLVLIGDRVALLPWGLWAIASAVACLGTSHAAFAVVPIAMSLAHSHRINSTMMGIAMSSAIVGGALAPTSIVGITVQTVASQANLTYNAGLMFALSIGINALVVLVAFFLFGGRELIARSRGEGKDAPTGGASLGNRTAGGVLSATKTAAPVATQKLTALQVVVIVSIFVLIGGFFALTQLGVDINLGVVALTIAVVIALIDPKIGRKAIARVDWGTILLLGGIITYVGVLTRLGAIDQLGEMARSVSSPLLAAFVICVVAALVSAFASTIGIIGALIPLAVPLLVVGGGLEMTGFIYALAISASLVDCAPFGTTGATIVASTVEEDRPRVYRNLTIWGLAMVIIGPVVTLATMVVPFLWL
ncbi:SLC13 family permease [Microbacterium murale]|uniref:Na+/H+ antiporter NhaD/arsenite permease-like protein n=1 Tax=Microbacterium murale TaxID=1081040 RepID=A0ABU0P8W7_9MICO|nr:SLC13 family permease [Microbacterium murale]MDQ0643784.1 Na+/H+ antiporter NhaD/arsenite permease-like protein [Microbacterium murale]